MNSKDSVGICRDDGTHGGCHTQPSGSSLAWWWLVGSRCRHRRSCSRSSYRFETLLLWWWTLLLWWWSLLWRWLLSWGTLLRLRWRSLLWRWLLWDHLQKLERVLIRARSRGRPDGVPSAAPCLMRCPFSDADRAEPHLEVLLNPAYIARMLWRVRNSRGRPMNAPAAFIHPCQPIVAKHSKRRRS